MGKIIYGTVFLLDADFTDQHIDENFSAMSKNGLNTVVFWPPVFFKSKKMDFTLHKKAFAIAEKHNLKVIVELTGQIPNMEYFPDYLYKRKYAVTDIWNQVIKDQNGSGELNLNHPYVRKLLSKNLSRIVKEYKDMPALLSWDIWNETHFKSFDKYTLKKFQRWLKKKYKNIVKLNEHWQKTYTSFSQVDFDLVFWGSIMIEKDLLSFRQDNLKEIAVYLNNIVKSVDLKHSVIVDNVMSNLVMHEFDRGTDDWKVGLSAEHYGISFYPKTGGRLLKDNFPWIRSLTFSGAASAGGGSFYLSEMQSHYYSDLYTVSFVSEDDILKWNIEAISHNAKCLVYWKWAPFKRGFQIGGRGLVLADGTPSKRLNAVKKITSFLTENESVYSASRDTGQIGILFDHENNFNIKTINSCIKNIIGDNQLEQSIHGLYRKLFQNNISCDIISGGQLSGKCKNLKTLFLTYQVTVNQSQADSIRKFIENGGTVIANYPFMDINENGQLHKNIPGGYINDILKIKHIDNLYLNNGALKIAKKEIILDNVIEIQEIEIYESQNCQIHFTINGYPLLISRNYGKGIIYYFTSSIWNYIFNDNSILGDHIIKWFNGVLKLKKFETQADIQIIPTINEKEIYFYILNYQRIKNLEFTTEYVLDNPLLVFGNGTLNKSDNRYTVSGDDLIYIIKGDKN